MGRRILGLALALTALLAAWPAGAASRVPVRRFAGHVRPFRLHPGLGIRPRFCPLGYPPLLGPGSPDDNMPPPIGEPSPLMEDQLGDDVALPHGFSLTVPFGRGGAPPVPATLNRFREVGPALAACWTPPAAAPWSAVTVRLAFRRDGTIYGVPRVPFVGAATPEIKSELAQSLLAALKTCKPLPFSPSLGAAVAGEIFAIRLVNQD